MTSDDAQTELPPQGAVIAGVIPGQSPRVVQEAARFAHLLGAPLIVTYVDVTRFVTYEDPDGYVHSAPLDFNIDTGDIELSRVRRETQVALEEAEVEWTVWQLVGDPALAMKQLAERSRAVLFVVGTRKRGIGESIREFFTGSVAARLSHRQPVPVLVVPLDPSPDDGEELWPEA